MGEIGDLLFKTIGFNVILAGLMVIVLSFSSYDPRLQVFKGVLENLNVSYIL
jgi:hypothetical protein